MRRLRFEGIVLAFGGVPVLLIAFGSTSADAQLQHPAVDSSGSPSFEVATVKPDDESKLTRIEVRVYPGGRLVIRGQSARALIAEAFDLAAWQVVGGDKWVDGSLYDVEAKPPEELRSQFPMGEYSDHGIQNREERQMLQKLLAERFHLTCHVEHRQGEVYRLQLGGGPLRLEKVELNLYKRSEDGTMSPSSDDPTGDYRMMPGRPVELHQFSIPQFARTISGVVRVPVVDETGLTGFYNFLSKTAVTREELISEGVAYVISEVATEAGLKLVKSQGSVETLVIDHVELPTEN